MNKKSLKIKVRTVRWICFQNPKIKKSQTPDKIKTNGEKGWISKNYGEFFDDGEEDFLLGFEDADLEADDLFEFIDGEGLGVGGHELLKFLADRGLEHEDLLMESLLHENH